MKTLGRILLIFGLQGLALGASIPAEDEDNGLDLPDESGVTEGDQHEPEMTTEIPEPRQAIAPPETCFPPSALDYHLERPYGYFKYHEEVMNWSEAKETCRTEGTSLLSVGSRSELVFIKLMLTSRGDRGWHWIDNNNSRIFTSVINNDTMQNHCKVVFYNPDTDVAVHGLSDCHHPHHFVCKKDTAVAQDPQYCAPPAALGYELVRGMGYYKYHSSAVTWNEARQTCEAEGTHLLVISSESEDLLIRLLLAKKKDLEWNWVGFSSQQYYLVTVTGENMYKRWFQDQPEYGWENCGQFRYSSESSSGMGLAPCGERFSFICEQELFRK